MSLLSLIVGFTALTLGLMYRVPQVVKIYRTKKGDDISVRTLHIQNLSYVLYVVYGVLEKDIIYISSSIVGILQNLLILALKKYYASLNVAVETQKENNSV